MRGFIDALGGGANLVSVDACTTRLRLVVADQGAVDEPGLKALGARGLIRPSARDLQVVIGPTADNLAREIREALGSLAAAPALAAPATEAPAAPADTAAATALLAAIGGAGNLRDSGSACSRVRLTLADDGKVDEAALRALGVRGLAHLGPGSWHVLLGPDADRVAQGLRVLAPQAG